MACAEQRMIGEACLGVHSMVVKQRMLGMACQTGLARQVRGLGLADAVVGAKELASQSARDATGLQRCLASAHNLRPFYQAWSRCL